MILSFQINFQGFAIVELLSMSGLWKLLLSRVGGVKHKMVIKLALVLGSRSEELRHLLPSSIVQLPCSFFYMCTLGWFLAHKLFIICLKQVVCSFIAFWSKTIQWPPSSPQQVHPTFPPHTNSGALGPSSVARSMPPT
jgi:hypothetical protein